MPKFSKGHNSGKIKWIFKKFNQVIYSSSPISWPSFKPLAQILFKISCWQDFILIFTKGITTEREITRIRKKYGSAIFPRGIHIYFKTLACMVHKILHESDFILIFSKGHNSRKGDNLDKKKMCVSYFSMKNPYMKFQNPSMHSFWRTDARTHRLTTQNQYAPATSSMLGA